MLEELEQEYSGLKNKVRDLREYLWTPARCANSSPKLRSRPLTPVFGRIRKVSAVMRQKKRLENVLATESDLVRRGENISAYFDLGREGENVEADLRREIGRTAKFGRRLENRKPAVGGK